MSAQGGILYTDARPVPNDLVTRLTGALAERGPNGTGCHREPGLVMVNCALHVSPEDERSTLPAVSPRGTVITWDGRLDNRADLFERLGGPSSPDVCDAHLARAVYERWGTSGFAHLIGDWSLSIWDPADRTIVLASDYMGVRPLYYHATPNRFAWSSELSFLTHVADAFDDLDPEYMVSFLIWSPTADLTPYRRILSVPSTHAVTFAAPSGQVSHRRYWDFAPKRTRYRELREYDERLVFHFREAVADRLRTRHPVWSQLSGGLDSSSVACMAATLIRDRAVEAPVLRTVTFTSSRSPEWSERPFVQAVEEYCGLQTHYVDLDEHEVVLRPTLHSPGFTHAGDLTTHTLMAREGARVLLSGRFGDSVMGGMQLENAESATDALVELRPWTYARELYRWSLGARMPLIESFGRSLVPLLPSGLQHRIDLGHMLHRQLKADPEATGGYFRPFSIDPGLLKRVWSGYPSFANMARSKGMPGHRYLLMALYRSSVLHRLRPMDGLTQLSRTCPYSDRRLVEFVLSIPSSVLYGPGQNRALMRRAFLRFVPARVLERTSKGHFAPTELRQLRAWAHDMLPRVRDLHVVQLGYIDPISLERRLSAVVNRAVLKTGNLINILRLETWLEVRQQAAGRFPTQARQRADASHALRSIPL